MKLKSLLEIKSVPAITPEMVDKFIGDSIKKNKNLTYYIMNLEDKFGYWDIMSSNKKDLIGSTTRLRFLNMLYNDKKLNDFYKELKQLTDNNIQESMESTNTRVIVKLIYDKIGEGVSNSDFKKILGIINGYVKLDSSGSWVKAINKLSPDRQKQLYDDLEQLNLGVSESKDPGIVTIEMTSELFQKLGHWAFSTRVAELLNKYNFLIWHEKFPNGTMMDFFTLLARRNQLKSFYGELSALKDNLNKKR